jgi:hypothetical protein
LTAGSGVLLRPWGLGDAQAVMDAYQDEASGSDGTEAELGSLMAADR